MGLSSVETLALMLSLKVASWSVVVSLPLGIATAWLLERRDFYGRTIFNALVHVPLVVPPIVVGYLLLIAFGRQAPLGRWLSDTFGMSLSFDWKGAALAAGVMGFPLMVRAIRQSLAATDLRMESVAATLGASRWRIWWTISLPLALPGVIAGCILAFARALGEFGATITFVANIPGRTQTLPLALFSALQQPGGEALAARFAVLSLVLAVAAIAASEVLIRAFQTRVRID
ncbi:MAG: molybdate ABC transporter permease subunit [Pseudomonadota bacterium]